MYCCKRLNVSWSHGDWTSSLLGRNVSDVQGSVFSFIFQKCYLRATGLLQVFRFLQLSCQCSETCLSTVSPEDSRTSVLLNQGTFSWQGPDSRDNNKEGETETVATKGSLLLHSLNLHITKVKAIN